LIEINESLLARAVGAPLCGNAARSRPLVAARYLISPISGETKPRRRPAPLAGQLCRPRCTQRDQEASFRHRRQSVIRKSGHRFSERSCANN